MDDSTATVCCATHASVHTLPTFRVILQPSSLFESGAEEYGTTEADVLWHGQRWCRGLLAQDLVPCHILLAHADPQDAIHMLSVQAIQIAICLHGVSGL